MSILIKDMKMPTDGRILIVFPSGRVLEVSADATQDIFRETKAVPVPPHGRLIDADVLIDGEFQLIRDNIFTGVFETVLLSSVPTIIEAEEGEV